MSHDHKHGMVKALLSGQGHHQRSGGGALLCVVCEFMSDFRPDKNNNKVCKFAYIESVFCHLDNPVLTV